MLHSHPSPAGFWRHEFAPSPGNKKGFFLPQLKFFTASPIKGEGIGRTKIFPLPSWEGIGGGGYKRKFYTIYYSLPANLQGRIEY